MSKYAILKYSYDQAKKMNVLIKPSNNQNKKIDVFNNEGKFITSIGAIDYNDYPTYIKTNGIKYANERRRLYKIRHNKNRNKVNTRSYYADRILW